LSGPQLKVKSFDIQKRLVFEAWEKVRANTGAPGVDAVSITEFESKERSNLYKLWNRMSSGSYFPGPVRAVEIPKDYGAGVRLLGVPNVADRVSQTAAAMLLEGKLEPIFHPDSYGYRPLGVQPMTLWPWPASVAGNRTGRWTLMSGPFSIPFPMICYSKR
jgi:RNA-directed DNA polymerase